MINKKLVYGVLLLLGLNSCSTYTTFYSKMYKDIDIATQSEIHRLDLSDQNLKKLPSSLAGLKDLRMINLSKNTRLDLDSTFRELASHRNLEVLILDSLDIKEIPVSIKFLSNLKQISLVHNPKLHLKQVIAQISELPIEFLNLKSNNLSRLPENITQLTGLKDLNLSYNHLNDHDSYVYLGKLPYLYSLWIDHNKLKELPNTIGKLIQIRFLYIDHNELEILPDQLTNMKKLWVLHAGYNKFETLPEVFTTMKVLLLVHINNNQIKMIPKAYETKKYPLAGLLLDNNPLPAKEIRKAKKIFNGFFLLSFEQMQYN